MANAYGLCDGSYLLPDSECTPRTLKGNPGSLAGNMTIYRIALPGMELENLPEGEGMT